VIWTGVLCDAAAAADEVDPGVELPEVAAVGVGEGVGVVGVGLGVGVGDGVGVTVTGGAGVELTPPPPPPPQPLSPNIASDIRAVAPHALRLLISAWPLPRSSPSLV